MSVSEICIYVKNWVCNFPFSGPSSGPKNFTFINSTQDSQDPQRRNVLLSWDVCMSCLFLFVLTFEFCGSVGVGWGRGRGSMGARVLSRGMSALWDGKFFLWDYMVLKHCFKLIKESMCMATALAFFCCGSLKHFP